MKSFKYKGTPEQMAKVAEWLLSKGFKWWDDDREGVYLHCTLEQGDFLYVDYDGYAVDSLPPMPAALELEIFGKTENSLITEDAWKENTGVQPVGDAVKIDVKYVDQQDYCNADASEFWWDKKGCDADITHWRFHKPEDAKYYVQPATSIGELLKPKFLAGEEYSKDPTTPKKPMCLEDAYDQPEYTDDDYKMDMKIATTTVGKIKSDGGPTNYYELTIKNRDGEVLKCQVGDVIRAMVGNDFDLGNVVKATRRIWCDAQGYGKEGIDMQYDVKKINYFANEFYEANK